MLLFPSPLGASYFQIGLNLEVTTKEDICFRPLSGHLISKSILMYHPEWSIKFPSPLGASYFQICADIVECTVKGEHKFPSPLGASYFQMKLRSSNKGRYIVSVPSRGILFPNKIIGEDYCVMPSFPSPLGASYFQIRFFICSIAFHVFPSPLGASYFQILSADVALKVITKEFPSPLGASYFQIKYNEETDEAEYVSVPSRGILFPNTARQSPLFCWLF